MKRSLRFTFLALSLGAPIPAFFACSSNESTAPNGNKDSAATETSTDDAEVDASQGRCSSAVVRAGRRLGGSVALMLDGSGSMTQDGRYTRMKTAVLDALTAFELRKDPAFTLSAYVFDGTVDPNPPFTVQAPTALDAALIAKVKSALDDDSPVGPSSVLPALVAGADAVTKNAPAVAGGSRNVALVFDNINVPPDDLVKTASDLSKRAADPIRTFVVGFPETPVDFNIMAALAVAGDTAVGGCQVTSKSPPLCFGAATELGAKGTQQVTIALTNVFEEIACRVELDGVDYDGGGLGIVDGGPDAAFAQPTLSDAGAKGAALTWKNGGATEIVPYDGMNGWTYGPRGRIQLHGQACRDVVTRTDLSVEVCPE